MPGVPSGIHRTLHSSLGQLADIGPKVPTSLGHAELPTA